NALAGIGRLAQLERLASRGNRPTISLAKRSSCSRSSPAGGQHHVLDAGALEIGDALDDLARRAQEVRLLKILERAVGTHDALDVRALEHERLLAVVGVHEMA